MPKGLEFLCVIPPLVAIALAIISRRVVLSLFLGILAAAILMSFQQLSAETNAISLDTSSTFVVATLVHLFESFLWPSLAQEDHLRVFCFTLMMGAMIGVIYRTGGMAGIAQLFAPIAKTRVGGQMAAWLMGMVIFFDDYANTLLVGNTMRPITDRLRISREKLAYIVDTTAAPVAGLSLISTWVATEISYIDDGVKRVVEKYGSSAFTGSSDGFWVVCQTIPYRFYVLLAIALVPLLVCFRREFGSMLTAERQAVKGIIDPRHPVSSLDRHSESNNKPGHWLYAIIPILTMICGVVGLIILTGWTAIVAEGGKPTIWSAFPQGNSYVALIYGSLAGLVVAICFARWKSKLPWTDIKTATIAGSGTVVPALVILWFAWSLSLSTTDQFLNTGEFLAGLVNPIEKPAWVSQAVFDGYCSIVSLQMLPTVIFIVAAVISFATGTSWGTMTIMTPLVIVVMYESMSKNGGEVTMSHPIMLAAVGSVLAGAIFGDHCSPISDTTVLSSQSSGCNHIAHVRTQMPYAIAMALVAVIGGTIPVGFGFPVWVSLVVSCGGVLGVVLVFGKNPEVPPDR